MSVARVGRPAKLLIAAVLVVTAATCPFQLFRSVNGSGAPSSAYLIPRPLAGGILVFEDLNGTLAVDDGFRFLPQVSRKSGVGTVSERYERDEGRCRLANFAALKKIRAKRLPDVRKVFNMCNEFLVIQFLSAYRGVRSVCGSRLFIHWVIPPREQPIWGPVDEVTSERRIGQKCFHSLE